MGAGLCEVEALLEMLCASFFQREGGGWGDGQERRGERGVGG